MSSDETDLASGCATRTPSGAQLVLTSLQVNPPGDRRGEAIPYAKSPEQAVYAIDDSQDPHAAADAMRVVPEAGGTGWHLRRDGVGCQRDAGNRRPRREPWHLPGVHGTRAPRACRGATPDMRRRHKEIIRTARASPQNAAKIEQI